MAKKNVRVVLKKNSIAKLLKLAKLVLDKHTADGAGSILNSFDMTDFAGKFTTATTADNNAQQFVKNGEEEFEKRDLAAGTSEDQSATTPGTVYFYLVSIRDFLLGKFKGQEQKLGEWGFEVNTTTSGKKPAAPNS